MVEGSAINFYERVNQKEVEEFYAGKTDPKDPHPVSIGIEFKSYKRPMKS